MVERPSLRVALVLVDGGQRGKMSGRQYNMYNVQNAESWKQRVLKEQLHNAPTFTAFALGTEDDDDVRSVASAATGISRASSGSKASIASTAALKRVRRAAAPQHPSRVPVWVTRSSRLICCAPRQIEELEARLESEKRKRQEIEQQLKEVQTVVKQSHS